MRRLLLLLAVPVLAASAYAAGGGRAPDKSPPEQVRGLAASQVTGTSITLRWRGSKDDRSGVVYDVIVDGRTVGRTGARTIKIAPLPCGTSHQLGVRARDAAGNVSKMTAIKAATKACDRSSPQKVRGLAASQTTRTSVTLRWDDSKDNRGVVAYDVSVDGRPAGSTDDTTFTVDSLACGTAYNFGVVARDAAGNISKQTAVVRAETDECDTTPPSAPGDLVVTDSGETSITISWEPSTDDDAVAGYSVFRDGSPAGTTAGTTWTETDLHCGRSYEFAVTARDPAGNVSEQATVEGETDPCDTTPPSVPGGLVVTGADETSISISWEPSTDDDAVAGYAVSRDGSSPAATSGTTWTETGLQCGKSYGFAVTARDPSGNVSAAGTLTGSTARCPASGYVAPGGVDFAPRWQHVAATFDGAVVRLFVDGVQVATQPAAGSMVASDGVLRMGGNAVYEEWYAGLMDDVRIYDRPLGPAEVAALMTAAAPDPSGLVAAYDFDEGGGSTAADASGTGNDGLLAGPAWTPDGHSGGALRFDGSDDWVTVADDDTLDLAAGMTLAAWVKPERQGGWQTLIVKEAAGYQPYGLWASGDTGRPSGHVYLDGSYFEARNGSPLGLARCTRAEPCASLDAAYHAIVDGTVEIADGVYGDQAILPDLTKAAGSRVVFRPAPGASVHLGEVIVRASHVELRDMRLEGWQARHPADDVTFRNISSSNMFVYSVSNVSVLGGEIGPGQGLDYDSAISTESEGLPPPTNVTIRGVRFFNWFRPAGTDYHTECLQIGAAVNLLIAGNVFDDCATHDVFIRSWGGPDHPLRNITIENNVFDATLDGFYALSVSNDLGSERASVLVRNNSSLQGMFLDGADADITVVGNILDFQGGFACTATVYRYNVYESGSPCDATDLVAPVDYVDRATLDLHLAPGSVAIDRGDPASFPADDADGDARPLGSAPDAGADEAG